jgi:signal transduction histidine kinase
MVRVGDQNVYSVADDGIGVAPQDRADVFHMFHRLHRSAGPPGSGMGLAICKRVVERHGGRIWVDDGIDGGLRVSCTLPAVDD